MYIYTLEFSLLQLIDALKKGKTENRESSGIKVRLHGISFRSMNRNIRRATRLTVFGLYFAGYGEKFAAFAPLYLLDRTFGGRGAAAEKGNKTVPALLYFLLHCVGVKTSHRARRARKDRKCVVARKRTAGDRPPVRSDGKQIDNEVRPTKIGRSYLAER